MHDSRLGFTDDSGMPIAYISGPYSGHFLLKCYNIHLARQFAKKYWKLGYAVICPHSNSALFDKVVPHETFIKGDLALVQAATVVIFIGEWDRSKGALDELWEAVKHGKDIIFENKESWGKALVQRILKLAWGDSSSFHSCLVIRSGTKADDLDAICEGGVLYSVRDGILQETPAQHGSETGEMKED